MSSHALARSAPRQAPRASRWLYLTLALAIADLGFLAVVTSRPGLPGVVLWYVFPPLLGLAAAILLVAALVRSWRDREIGGRDQLAGMAAIAIVLGSLALFRTYPSSHDSTPSGVAFRLPLEGPVTVAWGGGTPAVNYHVVMPDQRWAFDLLVTEQGQSFRGDGTRLADYHAYGRPVLAPAAGHVEAIEDGEPDGPIGGWRVRRALGNHIVLRVAPSQFLFIAHLQPGSTSVAVGEDVEAGQRLGRVGNSGNSSEPHVHLHLQDTATPYLGEGIPFYFHRYRAHGVEIGRGMPAGGRERRSRLWPGGFTGEIVEQMR